MTTKTMFEWDEVPERSVDFDDFEKFKEEVLGVLECIYEENLIYKPCGSRIKYLVETFPNMKRQVLIDILKFVVNAEFDEVPERSVEEVEYCDDEVNEEELDNFIEILYKYR